MVALSVRTSARPMRWGWTVLTVAVAVTIAGLLLSVRTLNPTPAPKPTRFGIGDDVKTSFGIVAVEFIRNVDGVSHRALSGATHGVSGLVEKGNQQIQVAVALTNRNKAPLTYSVRQFQLYVTTAGKTKVLPATAGDLPDGRILPDAGIEGHLDFTIVDAKSALSLHFSDPATAAPVVIDLGVIAASSGAAQPAHSHG
ncbi:MAG: hypothetical protein QOE71_3134 [Pseudonocardiales bacterium]|nr:hypothetical protein [Pseudonocardiales bacterium]